MAYANERLGVQDVAPALVPLLRNKLYVRNVLHAGGLSQVKAETLTPERLQTLQGTGADYFIKPVQGIASYGTFKLTPDLTWATLERIAEQIRQDTVYANVIGSGVEFLVEDYLDGAEFSFEVLVLKGEAFILAIHEKCGLTEDRVTVLEESCTSPPISIGHEATAAGISWIQSVLQCLEVTDGCFHIESRYNGSRWDLIEVNPRIGGSLISHSVEALNGEASMLTLWLDLLLEGAAFRPTLQRLSYPDHGAAPGETATFFRVYFASPGRIARIVENPIPWSPRIKQVLLQAGDEIPDTAREVFLGQFLWQLPMQEHQKAFPTLLAKSAEALQVVYEPTAVEASTASPLLLIVDYNLSRVGDVAHIVQLVRDTYDAGTVLVRHRPGEIDRTLCDYVVDLDPLAPDFVEQALLQLQPLHSRLKAGLVFSDNAVQSGALLLEKLGLPVDSASLAAGAYSKQAYRNAETSIRDLLKAQRVMAPAHAEIQSLEDLHAFAADYPQGFVVKPSCEGNNRGVVAIRQGDDLETAFNKVVPYLSGGVLCERLIPYEREYSYDGVGDTSFITEKVSAPRPYPVEIAQILPARLTETERASLMRAGRLANLLVGQRRGPFHNEIKLSDDGSKAAVVEPNRRPAGMKIWTLARAVYGIDFYSLWVDSAWGHPRDVALPHSTKQAATVMLGVPSDGDFTPPSPASGNAMFDRVLKESAAALGIPAFACRQLEFAWMHTEERFIPALPRDNADFAASACFLLDDPTADIRQLVKIVQCRWLLALGERENTFFARQEPAYQGAYA
ncbi:ATP-grasp domain-containing protein [Candidatus Kirkpatrickella diaphorinae]|uniref:ATP-grasp domain-containing protein n=1 Tax=Candidatus Kirkpatrickella diaphorinae TaxID=2984322 RepID=A0ABY6GJ08_9PROT|nr:ATP-grasp domain-containing protein [Candidatus Kirkpatrickella diaphorinae]UYH51405.1 ATP-grasp domain-containing protein [Candidatus Kirkpatrickella diaphorinae]